MKTGIQKGLSKSSCLQKNISTGEIFALAVKALSPSCALQATTILQRTLALTHNGCCFYTCLEKSTTFIFANNVTLKIFLIKNLIMLAKLDGGANI